MTSWMPDLHRRDGPLYVRLADSIEQDILSGRLAGGEKLPPQRNLAFDIGVTLGTVTRAYALVRERGMVAGEVGRGTYVVQQEDTTASANAAGRPDVARWTPQTAPGDDGTIRFDSSAAFSNAGSEQLERIATETIRSAAEDMVDYVRAIEPDWRRAGADWMALGGDWRPDPANVVPVHGVHGGIMSVLSAVTNPGDRIVSEALTYATVPRAAHMIGRRNVSVAIDEHGLLPEALETVCAQQHPRLLFVMPAVHNPTTAALPAERREAIVDIARRHNMWIVEDSLYGSLAGDPHPPIAALAPDITFHLSGLSKAAAAGLRAGWVACPPMMTTRVLSSQKMLTGGDSYLLNELAARLVNSGAANDIRREVRDEAQARLAIVRDIFSGCDFASRDHLPFVWLRLPEPWLSGTFKNAALDERIRIDDEDEFKAGRGDSRFHGVRLAFACLVRDRETLTRGMRTLRQLLDAGPPAYHSYD